MKLKIYILFVVITAGPMFTACNKFLDVKPKGLDIVNSIDKYNGLFNNTNLLTFINVRNVPGALATVLGYPGAPLLMSDDVFSSAAYLATQPLYYQNLYQWKDDAFLPDDESSEWGTFYSQNYIYNIIANGVMDATDGTTADKKALLAEARANRAYMHLMEVNYFAKPYAAATASTDPGVPIVVLADAGGSGYKRASVQQVYDFILTELKESIPDLPVQTLNKGRLGQTGGYYLLGLTYFWMGDYKNALAALNNCRNSFPNYKAGTLALYDYNTLMATWVTAGQPWLGASKYPTQTVSTENIYLKQISINWATGRNTVYLKPKVYAMYSTNDQRKKFFYNNSTTNAIAAPGLPGQQRNGPTNINWGPNMPDLYLMLAECEARGGDLVGAKADLEALRKTRMPLAEATVTATTQDAWIKAVLDERMREFASTGIRWFDMRRLSNDPTYNNIDPTHPLDAANYTLKNERLTLRIPPAILNLNPGMVDNP